MREHPIPQDITGYKFHIIGSMTLKQFAEVAVGVVIAMIFYSTNLPSIVKWPFIILFVGLGVVAAFVPINQRPLDRWIVIFINVLYRPTQYYWRRVSSIPSVFSYKPGEQKEQENDIDFTPMKRQKIREYMDSMKTATTIEPEPMDIQESSRLDDIMKAFGTQQSVEPVEITKIEEKPNLEVRVRSLSQTDQEVAPMTANQPYSQETPVLQNYDIVSPNAENNYLEQPEIYTESEYSEPNQSLKNTPVEIFIGPQNTHPTSRNSQEEVNNLKPLEEIYPTVSVFPQEDSQTLPNTLPSLATVYNANLPFPSKPTVSNQVVGMVLDQQDTILTDVVVKVLDKNNKVERAVSTNALGQFSITTPLADGRYILQIEKDGYEFQNMDLTLEGQIVEPLEIRSL